MSIIREEERPDIHLTEHGKIRLQQRSIPIEILEVIQDYGTSTRSHGAERFYLAGRTAAENCTGRSDALPLLKRYERYLNVYVVISDGGTVITAGRRNKRFKRDVNIKGDPLKKSSRYG